MSTDISISRVLIIMRGRRVMRSKYVRSPPAMGAYALAASVREATSSNSRTFAISSRGAMRPGASPINFGPGFCFEMFCCASTETAANEPKPASALRRLITVFFIRLQFSSAEVCSNQRAINGSQSRPAGLRHRHDELALQDFVNPLYAGGTVGGESPTSPAADTHRICP